MPKQRNASDLVSTGEAARALNLSAERIRQLVREGRLSPLARTAGGQVFDRADVEALAVKRADGADEAAHS